MLHSEAIDPIGIEWQRVDDKYITVKYITTAAAWLLTFAILAVPLVLGWTGVWALLPLRIQVPGLSILAVWAVADFVLVPRRVRAIGYFEREDDLLIRKGLLWQRVVAVPYGRLQYVDIEAGPIMRKFGLCTVQLKTASAATDATIPGAVRSEGARLRDELSVRGQARLAGL